MQVWWGKGYLPNLNVSPTNKLRIKEEKCDSTAKKLNRHKLSNWPSLAAPGLKQSALRPAGHHCSDIPAKVVD